MRANRCHKGDREGTRKAQLVQSDILRLDYTTSYEREKEEVAPHARDQYHFHARPNASPPDSQSEFTPWLQSPHFPGFKRCPSALSPSVTVSISIR